jgi:hypothetical protein
MYTVHVLMVSAIGGRETAKLPVLALFPLQEQRVEDLVAITTWPAT